MHNNRSPFPTALQAALLLLATLVLEYLLSAAFYDARNSLGLTGEQMSVLVTVLGNGIVISVAMHLQGCAFRDLIQPGGTPWLPTLVLVVPPVLLLTPLILLLDTTLISALQSLLPLSAYEVATFSAMNFQSLPMALAVCVVAPVVEEMFFRGVLLRGFLQLYPRARAIGYSALFFGVAHLNIYQFCLAFFLGLLLGLLYERGRSLLPCMALHAALNTSVYLLSSGTDTSAADDSAGSTSLTWLVALLLAAAGAFALQKVLRLWSPPRQAA
ncbi:CPBP family intramembrane metalloprotease [Roseateles sp. SL47]|uniref:CPBP family intramembrane glutamic endopeptidase n=1 Tax=Roseateles sp. SL47 TaxID=2995138 RepID=UPI00226ED0E6|nr:CPBP family intramembrane glutamic endopeptidase [Roseateles sp. SL47]WAC71697.1 CPBP family intramembrane metalloprotease [Roseateles sp. SL47]